MPKIRANNGIRKWPRLGELIEEAEPCLYQVVHVEAA
jgi:hypothetical protein